MNLATLIFGSKPMLFLGCFKKNYFPRKLEIWYYIVYGKSLKLTNFKAVTDNLNQKNLFNNTNFIQLVMVHDLKQLIFKFTSHLKISLAGSKPKMVFVKFPQRGKSCHFPGFLLKCRRYPIINIHFRFFLSKQLISNYHSGQNLLSNFWGLNRLQ